MSNEIHHARILIADDEEANVRILLGMLRRAGYTALTSTTNSSEIVSLYSILDPDLILLDLHMPVLDGFQVLEQLNTQIPPSNYVPVLVLTADISGTARQRALTLGAKDFVTKPFDLSEVLLRIRNLLETRLLHRQLRTHNASLEAQVRDRTRDLEAAQIEILERLAAAAEYRDDDTGQHTRRVGQLSARLAARLGLAAEQVELIRRAAPLHDVGKIGVPDAILLKPAKLTPEEFAVMQKHTNIGAGILAGSHSPYLQMAEAIAISHHERWDGTGYPRGLHGQQIPLAGRIVSLADVFDALTHERPYKPAWAVADAVAEITRQSGRQFDSSVVQAFLELFDGADGLPIVV